MDSATLTDTIDAVPVASRDAGVTAYAPPVTPTIGLLPYTGMTPQAKMQREVEGIVATARPLRAIQKPNPCDGTELLQGRFLCRGGSLLVIGPAGSGKSSLIMQSCVTWAAGKTTLGFTPTRPLRSVIIQAEDDDGDLCEMRDGVCVGLAFDGVATHSEVITACGNVIVVTLSGVKGDKLAMLVRDLIAKHKPDILAINPAFAFVDGNVNDGDVVRKFLRDLLDPILKDTGVALVMVHHCNKPSKGYDRELNGLETAYQGSGHAEFANYFRATVALQATSSPSLFTLTAGKRGKRLGWTFNGKPIIRRYIAQSEGYIYWRDANSEDMATIEKTPKPKKPTNEELASKARAMLIDKEVMPLKEFRASVKADSGVGDARVRDITKLVAVDGIIIEQGRAFGADHYIGLTDAVQKAIAK